MIRISKITASIQTPSFGIRQTPSQIFTGIFQTNSTLVITQTIPTLSQSKHTPIFHNPKSIISSRNSSQILYQVPNILPKFQIRPFTGSVTHNPISRNIDSFVKKIVIVVTKEASIKKNTSGCSREAAGQSGAAGSVAEEAVGVSEVFVTLS
jgi:hypothetical protein